MRFKLSELSDLQLKTIAQVLVDLGRAVILGSVVVYFIPALSDIGEPVELLTALKGLVAGLILIGFGVRILGEVKDDSK